MLISDLSIRRPLLLDTHIWIWASGNAGGPARFAREVAPAIEVAALDRRLLASVTSVWEIGLKARKGELLVAGDLMAWIREQQRYPGIRILAISTPVALDSTRLPRWTRASDGQEHRDPCDRFIVATARRRGAIVVTCDALILDYAREGHVLAYDAGS